MQVAISCMILCASGDFMYGTCMILCASGDFMYDTCMILCASGDFMYDTCMILCASGDFMYDAMCKWRFHLMLLYCYRSCVPENPTDQGILLITTYISTVHINSQTHVYVMLS